MFTWPEVLDRWALARKRQRPAALTARNVFENKSVRFSRVARNLIFFETFMYFGEMEMALQARNELGDALAICSFACTAGGRISSGMPLAEAFEKLRALGAQIMGVNCMNGPEGMVEVLQRAAGGRSARGLPECRLSEASHEGRLSIPPRPGDFASQPARWWRKGRVWLADVAERTRRTLRRSRRR